MKRDILGVEANIFSIEYDANRNARIALLHYFNGEERYILCPRGFVVGDIVSSHFNVPIKLGNALPL